MKYLFFLLFTVSTLLVHSQQKVKNGSFVEHYENGQIKISGQFKANKKNGDWKEYYKTGELKSTYSYTKGRLNIGKKVYFKSGSIKTEMIQVDEGKIFREYFESGKIYFERNKSYAKEYYENGNLKSEGNYFEKELTGVWKQYFETGELEWEVAYVSSYLEGVYKQYYKKGQLKTQGVNKKGKKDGLEKRYFEDGKLEWEGNYSKGEFVGNWKGYDVLGKQIYKLKYKNGTLIKGNGKLAATNIPDGLIEKLPVYPGCENVLGIKNQKTCISEGISKHISENFNSNIAAISNLEGKQRIMTIFKINKQGHVTDVKARAPNKMLESEAIRVINSLPKMKPGMQKGKPVIIPYSIPIVFVVPNNNKK